jgi:hypothetical protein
LVSKRDIVPLATIVGQLLQKQNKWSDKRTKEEIDQSIERLLSYEFE